MNEPSPMDYRWLGRISWQDAYSLQERLVEQRLAQDIVDTVLLMEHEPVITIGRTPDKSSLLAVEHTGAQVVETNRGGQATYHGPGQLVGYVISDLTAQTKDLHVHLRAVEQSVITLCRRLHVPGSRRESLTGVWVEERKIASIGVGVRKWITMHGFALNVTRESLEGFQEIVPCGIQGVEMTCLEAEGGGTLTVESVAAEYVFPGPAD
jgi:lipoyl(octanoyl) transferase